MTRFAITMLFGITVIGCGGAAVPQDQLASSLAAVRAAEVGGAEGEPRAALLHKKAQDQIEEAKKLIANDDNERAAMILKRAQADAELALAIAQEQKLTAEATAARQQLEELKQRLSTANARGGKK